MRSGLLAGTNCWCCERRLPYCGIPRYKRKNRLREKGPKPDLQQGPRYCPSCLKNGRNKVSKATAHAKVKP